MMFICVNIQSIFVRHSTERVPSTRGRRGYHGCTPYPCPCPLSLQQGYEVYDFLCGYPVFHSSTQPHSLMTRAIFKPAAQFGILRHPSATRESITSTFFSNFFSSQLYTCSIYLKYIHFDTIFLQICFLNLYKRGTLAGLCFSPPCRSDGA